MKRRKERYAESKKEQERSVLIHGSIHLYNVKSPYTKSGQSVLGALEYSPDDDKVRCHECGLWVVNLGIHLRSHDLNARNYKIKHGLKLGTALMGDGLRKKRIAAGIKAQKTLRRIGKSFKNKTHLHRVGCKTGTLNPGFKTPEKQNSGRVCRQQLIERIRTAAMAAKTSRPSLRTLGEYDISRGAIKFHFGNMKAAMKSCDLDHNPRYGSPYTDDQLLSSLVDFMRLHGRPPSYSDNRRGLIANTKTFERRFGSWSAAKQKAIQVLGETQ